MENIREYLVSLATMCICQLINHANLLDANSSTDVRQNTFDCVRALKRIEQTVKEAIEVLENSRYN